MSATPNIPDNIEEQNRIKDLIGELVYYVGIQKLQGQSLSKYSVKKIYVELTKEEKTVYSKYRDIYINFLRRCNIDLSDPSSWSKFIILCSYKKGGKEAYRAYCKQKKIASFSKLKLKAIWDIIRHHKDDQIIIFTADNDAAYKIGETFFLPVITYRTKVMERKEFLENFRQGQYRVIVTSKVLNEGVDIPEANIGVVVSGSSSVKEHVQRLGRLLRPKENKQAILYEIITKNTSEIYVSNRRRKHPAYL